MGAQFDANYKRANADRIAELEKSLGVVTMDNADLTQLAAEFAPLSFDRAGYIWGRSAKGGRTVIANIRGWGYLTGKGEGALGLPDKEASAEQMRWCEMICRAVNMLAAR